MPNQYGGNEDLDAVEFLKEFNEVALRARARGRSRPPRSRRRGRASRGPTYLGGLGLRLQVEHGLDARHARLLPARPDLPPLAPPRADVQPRLRVHRELHPAAVARRGRARQGLAAVEDAGRPLAEARQPARAVRLHVGAPRQEAAVHGPGVRPGGRVERTTRSLDWHLLENPEHAGIQSLVRDLNRAYKAEPALWEMDFDARGLLVDRGQRRRRQRDRVRAPHARTPSASSCSSATSRRCRATNYRIGLPRAGPLARGAQHRLGYYGGIGRRATSAASRPRRSAGTASRSRPRSRCRRSAVVWLVPDWNSHHPARAAHVRAVVVGHDHDAVAERARRGAGP